MPKGIPNKPREAQKRIPAGMPRLKLKVTGLDPNKKGYFASEDQIQELLDAGYTFVTKTPDIEVGEDQKVDRGSIVSRPASRSSDEKLYLMQIDKKMHAENQAMKQAAIDETENAILNPGETESTYKVKGTNRSSELV